MSGRIHITGNELTRFENIVINNSCETDAEFHRKMDETIMLAAKAAERQGRKSGKANKNISHKHLLKNNRYTWNLSAVKEPTIPTPVTTYGETPVDKSNAASNGKTTIEIYRMAMDMVFFPGKETIKDEQYVDAALQTAYNQVYYYFSNTWSSADVAHRKELDAPTEYMYKRMIAAIYGNNQAEQKEGMRLLELRSKWYNKFPWADILLWATPLVDYEFLQSMTGEVKAFPEMADMFASSKKLRNFAMGDYIGAEIKPGTLSNYDARIWYLKKQSEIPEMLDKNQTLERQAMEAIEFRNLFKNRARELMSDRKSAEELYEERAPFTWPEIIAKYKEKGYVGDDLWNEIIEASQRSNKTINESLNIPSWVPVKYK